MQSSVCDMSDIDRTRWYQSVNIAVLSAGHFQKREDSSNTGYIEFVFVNFDCNVFALVYTYLYDTSPCCSIVSVALQWVAYCFAFPPGFPIPDSTICKSGGKFFMKCYLILYSLHLFVCIS